MRGLAVVLTALVPCLAAAEPDLHAAFAGRTVDWSFGEQRFDRDGRTRDRLFRDRHGWWEVRDGALCLLWPPREDWECATVTLGPGAALRLVFPDGTIHDGKFRR